MSIQVKNKHFLLETENTTLILREYCGFLEQVYYGAKIPDYNLDYLRNDQMSLCLLSGVLQSLPV